MRITNAFYAELPLIQKICGDAVEVHVVQNVRGFFPETRGQCARSYTECISKWQHLDKWFRVRERSMDAHPGGRMPSVGD